MNVRTYSIKMFAVGFISGALTVGGLIGMASAHADENQDFLTCLDNHGVEVVRNKGPLLNLMGLVQNDLRNGFSVNTIVTNLVVYHDIPFSIAQIDVQCVEAATLLGN